MREVVGVNAMNEQEYKLKRKIEKVTRLSQELQKASADLDAHTVTYFYNGWRQTQIFRELTGVVFSMSLELFGYISIPKANP